MIGYISTENCREVYIRHYFGEEDIKPCGHCDNCLNANETNFSISKDEIFQVKKILKEDSLSFSEIVVQTGWDKARTKRLLSYLVREQKLIIKGEQYNWKN
jgi:ATP-dependent DNA helicase RecQ